MNFLVHFKYMYSCQMIFSGEIYKEYCQVINKNDSEKHKNELMDSLNILDYKDADIIATQYQIDIKKVVSDLKDIMDTKKKI